MTGRPDGCRCDEPVSRGQSLPGPDCGRTPPAGCWPPSARGCPGASTKDPSQPVRRTQSPYRSLGISAELKQR